jgi:hypothetical protein
LFDESREDIVVVDIFFVANIRTGNSDWFCRHRICADKAGKFFVWQI